jgi:hypothetical protein
LQQDEAQDHRSAVRHMFDAEVKKIATGGPSGVQVALN